MYIFQCAIKKILHARSLFIFNMRIISTDGATLKVLKTTINHTVDSTLCVCKLVTAFLLLCLHYNNPFKFQQYILMFNENFAKCV